MPKLKTHRGAAKRFKRSKGGKFLRSKAFKQHILSSKTTKRKRALRGTTVVADVDAPAPPSASPRCAGAWRATSWSRRKGRTTAR